jgi:DNA-binding transcriptional ArsR family regulator
LPQGASGRRKDQDRSFLGTTTYHERTMTNSSRKKEAEADGEVCCVVNGKPRLPGELEVRLESAGGLESVLESIPPPDRLKMEAGMHRALADPTRLRILHSLSRCDLCPCVLKEVTRLTDSKLSYHLSVLEQAGLIESYPLRKWRIYVLTETGREWMGG